MSVSIPARDQAEFVDYSESAENSTDSNGETLSSQVGASSTALSEVTDLCQQMSIEIPDTNKSTGATPATVSVKAQSSITNYFTPRNSNTNLDPGDSGLEATPDTVNFR